MEKKLRQSSIINQTKPYFHLPLKDTFQLNKRSLISTSRTKYNQQNQSPNKSKIKSLPNHIHTNLSNKTNFLLIFQSIQILRLSQQIQIQRRKLKDYERQIVNGQNYQIQIKQLNQHCVEMEKQIMQYNEQLQKMNKICQILFSQNQKIKKNRIVDQEKYKERSKEQGEKIKQMYDTKMRQFQQKYQKNVKKYELRILQLEQENNKIKDQHKLIIQDLKINLQEIYAQNHMLKDNKQNIKTNQSNIKANKKSNQVKFVGQLSQQIKISKLSGEILRLCQLLADKNTIIDGLQQNFKKLSQQKQCSKSPDKKVANINQNNLIKLQSQLNFMKKSYQQCRANLKIKNKEYEDLKKNQQIVQKDLEQIDKLRIISQNLQNQILQRIKQSQLYDRNDKQFQFLLTAEKSSKIWNKQKSNQRSIAETRMQQSVHDPYYLPTYSLTYSTNTQQYQNKDKILQKRYIHLYSALKLDKSYNIKNLTNKIKYKKIIEHIIEISFKKTNIVNQFAFQYILIFCYILYKDCQFNI